ncbi:hypothetical protein [Clostridium hydrogeniformans]|nr:hypothetical protein [Clostridium hydrogeniformans]
MIKKFLDRLFNTDEVEVVEEKSIFEMDKAYEKEAIEALYAMQLNIRA